MDRGANYLVLDLFETGGRVEPAHQPVRFGAFEVDLSAGELRKHGLRIRIQEQPFQVLAALLERPGEVVTRDELVKRLWPDGTFVDFERGLNAAITRLRQTLSDSADAPRYVETVARRGYRLVVPVEATPISPTSHISEQSVVSRRRHGWIWPAAALAAVIATAGGWWALSRDTSAADRPLTVRPFTTEPGFATSPSFSPDGNRVVFQWDQGKGEQRIFVKLVGPGDAVRLTTGSSKEECCPVWSPDGKFIAFARSLSESRAGVFLVPALGGAERKLIEFARSRQTWSLRYFDWTRDGNHLVLSIPGGQTSSLFLVATDSGEKAQLTGPPAGASDHEPSVSPDGRSVVFTRWLTWDSADLYSVGLTQALHVAAEPHRLTFESQSGRYAAAPAWSPDGREIIYTSNRDGSDRLWRIGLKAGATPRQVASAGLQSFFPTVSPQGRLVYAHWEDDHNIWRQELLSSGNRPAPVSLIASTADDDSAQYSPDGDQIAFQSWRSGNAEIWICGSDGQRCRQLTYFNGPHTGTPRWSADGGQIAFDSNAGGHFDIYVVDADGGRPRRLTDNGADNFAPSWSHDGKWIYFCSRVAGSDIWKIPSSGGAPVQVTRNGGLVGFESPDGRNLYYTKAGTRGMLTWERFDEKKTLWKCGLDGTGETPVAESLVSRSFAVTGNLVYYLRKETAGTTTLRVLDPATGKDDLISTMTKPVGDLSISPDGKYALYTQADRSGSSLMLAEGFR